MEDCHRKVILDNIEYLMNETDYTKLVNACEQTGLISKIMKNIIENTDEERIRHKRLFDKITRRGPQAYDRLFEILKDLKYANAANKLRNGEYHGYFRSLHGDKNKKSNLNNNNNTPVELTNLPQENGNNSSAYSDGCCQSLIDGSLTNNKILLKVYDEKIENFEFEVKKSKKWGLDTKINIYPMKSKNRGVFFMVNIIDFANNVSPEKRRNGAEVDGQSLLYLFQEFGFTTFYYKNLSMKEFYRLLDELIDSDYMKQTECFVLALMTHGSMVDKKDDRVEFYDGAIDNVNNILDRFKNDVCPYLVKKPKIFLFPFCRGEISDRGVRYVQTDSINESAPKLIPTYSDMLICYASVPGFKTHRDPDKGSWYIQKLCEIFAEHAHDTHIEDLLKMIGESAGKIRTVDGRLQNASYTNYAFNSKLYFNPGYYEDIAISF